MPRSPKRLQTQKQSKKTTSQPPNSSIQHGILFILPSESLTHVTASLDPKSLLSLGRVNRQLYEHVADDHTWAVAFKTQFIKLSPEADVGEVDTLLFQRSENTWRKEFLKRWSLRKKITGSRNATISHVPVNSSVASFILLPDKASLVAASLTYGIVSRSFAFTGKVVKGYLDAHGALNGQGIGNPNNEFAPDVSSITLHASGGGTAKVAWGFLNGDVALTTAPKVMELGRVAKFARCRPGDNHLGIVDCITFGDVHGSSAGTFVSACKRGGVKLWDAQTMRCLWTGQILESIPGADGIAIHIPVKCVAFDTRSGTIAVAGVNGELFIWEGFATEMYAELNPRATNTPNTLSPRSFCRIPSLELSSEANPTSMVIQTQLDSKGHPSVELAVAYEGQPHFWKLAIAFDLNSNHTERSHHVRIVKFESRASSPLTAFHHRFVPRETRPATLVSATATASTSTLLLPVLPEKRSLGSVPRSYVLAGDALGNLCIWDWDKETTGDLIASTAKEEIGCVRNHRMFVAHEDGAVTSIALDGPIFATGSANGSIQLFDTLSFELLRTFATSTTLSAVPGANRVTQIGLNANVLIASMGSRVYAWKGELSRGALSAKGKNKSSGGGRSTRVSAREEFIEVREYMKRSRHGGEGGAAPQQHFETRMEVPQTRAGELEQRQALDVLGLDEVEAVEYALMLSREEDALRQRDDEELSSLLLESAIDFEDEDDLLFEMADDFDSVPSSSSRRQRTMSRSSNSSSSAVSVLSGRPSSFLSTPTISPRLTPTYGSSPSLSPSGSSKLRVSPRIRDEPMEAGGLGGVSMSPLSLNRVNPNAWQGSNPGPEDFPLFGVTGTSSSTAATRTSTASLANWNTAETGDSPTSGQRSWSSVARSVGLSQIGGTSPILEAGLSSVSTYTPLASTSTSTPHAIPAASLVSRTRPIADIVPNFANEDEELQYVLQLSLAESRSREDA